jgi:hypothetical protein
MYWIEVITSGGPMILPAILDEGEALLTYFLLKESGFIVRLIYETRWLA